MGKKINPVVKRDVHTDFDGHLEKPIKKMNPRERIYYIWLQMLFRHNVKKQKVKSSS
ncbi:MAG: hypothetical protein NTV87_13360 [Ignavibacteriae bacterium]|nr:hypothetical protein [Ignavibacteriota bacterium]